MCRCVGSPNVYNKCLFGQVEAKDIFNFNDSSPPLHYNL